MADHETQREKTGAYALGLLSEDERREFETHLVSCFECVREVRELTEVTAALADSAGAPEPPARVRAAILEQIGGDRGAASRARGDASRWWAIAASIALVAAAAYVAVLRSRVDGLDVALVAARGQVAAAESTVAE